MDVIVNAANEKMHHDAGVAKAIADAAGGGVVQRESDEWITRHGLVVTGKVAAVTSAGALPCKCVVHVTGPKHERDQHLLRSAVRLALDKADELKCNSIALPAISSGIFGFPLRLCAKILIECGEEFARDGPKFVRRIAYTNIDMKTAGALHKALEEYGPQQERAGAANLKRARGGITRKASYFKKLFGFDEQDLGYEEIQASFAVENELNGPASHAVLRCKKAGCCYGVGHFSSPTLAELRAEAVAVKGGEGVRGAGISVTHSVTDDIMADHAHVVNNGALFQAASQFNCLEMVCDAVTPESGITDYVEDATQGPACALATAPALLYRNYLLRVQDGRLASSPAPRGQTRDRQLDTCTDMEEVLFRKTGQRFWEMRNGYLRSDANRLASLSQVLSCQETRDELKAQLRIGMTWDAQVVCADASETQRVSQAWCSAVPVSSDWTDDEPALHEDWEPLARLVLEASYEAALLAGVINGHRTGNRRVLLTFVGGGVFENKAEWIADAINLGLRKLAALDPPLGCECLIMHYRRVDPAVAAAIGLGQPASGKEPAPAPHAGIGAGQEGEGGEVWVKYVSGGDKTQAFFRRSDLLDRSARDATAQLQEPAGACCRQQLEGGDGDQRWFDEQWTRLRLQAQTHAAPAAPSLMEQELRLMPPGSRVAVVTLLGSLCPVTRAHVLMFEEARKLLLDAARLKRLGMQPFAACVGFISLNGDYHVADKLRASGDRPLSKQDRFALIELATADKAWLHTCRGSEPSSDLRRRWPRLTFCHFVMNGADDVVKYRKWDKKSRCPGERFITMGRRESMEDLAKGMRKSRVAEDEFFILGPVLPDISSTQARAASKRGDTATLRKMVHDDVADWLLKWDGHAAGASVSLPAGLAGPAEDLQAGRARPAEEDIDYWEWE